MDSISTRKRKDRLRGRLVRFVQVFWVAFAFFMLSMGGAKASTAVSDQSGWFIDMNRFSKSAHGTFTCEECHGTMTEDQKKHPDPENPQLLKKDATRIYDYSRCKSCHRPSYERYLLGEHAKALKEEQQKLNRGQSLESGTKKAPTCGDCHSAHYCKSHLSRAKTGKQMTRTCGSCHQAQMVTYLDDYHGKIGVNLGDEASAYCTDCHGAHHALSLKDKKAALEACQRCHPEAGDKFAEFVIHPTTTGLTKDDKEKRERVVIIKAVTWIMLIIVILVVGFFYGHSFVWLLRELHERLRKHR